MLRSTDNWRLITALMFMIQTMSRLHGSVLMQNFSTIELNISRHKIFPIPLYTTLLIIDANASFYQTLGLSKDTVEECICVFRLIQISLLAVK